MRLNERSMPEGSFTIPGGGVTVQTKPSSAATSQVSVPSLVEVAAESIRRMVLSGSLEPGERLIEERLTEELGISRPPLREALRMLQQEGLIEIRPRRGSVVATLTEEDVFEILTLRRALERLALELAVPVQDAERLASCHEALRQMEQNARDKDRGGLVESGYAFHASLVALAGHRRLTASYASVQQELLLCMARNLYVREKYHEDLEHHVARHRYLLELIEEGDLDKVMAEFAVHGESSFTEL